MSYCSSAPRSISFTLLISAFFLTSCAPPPPPQPVPHPDPTKESWYAPATAKITELAQNAQSAFKRGDQDKAAALIEEAKPITTRLLLAPHPTLAAVEAASDLDELYGEMLFTNHNYGWARMFFQKNTARWKLWTPQTPDTAQRLKLAQDAIDRCDKAMLGPL